MDNTIARVDLARLFKFVFKRIWVPILFAALFGSWMYYDTTYRMQDTYTATGTFYVYNSNPNLVNYQYATTTDLDSAVQLIDTYMIVVRSNKVMDVVTDRLAVDYPGITADSISSTLSMVPVEETGVAKVASTTSDPQLSTDIVNAVLDVAPQEIIRVVGAGNIEIIDYAVKPTQPDYRRVIRRVGIGVIFGTIIGFIVLMFLFLMDRKITSVSDIAANYRPPILASIKRRKKKGEIGEFMLTRESPMETLESYAKLRMNLLYTLVEKEKHSVVITSAISGEGKTTIAANLAISCSMGGKKVVLIDSDMRRACQRQNFNYDKDHKGLSDILVGSCTWKEAVISNIRETLDLIPSGPIPPNPAELLSSDAMKTLLADLEKEYDLVLLDMPPVNIVTDPLVVSTDVAGCVFVVSQNYSDRRDIRMALNSMQMTDMNVLGFVFYGDKVNKGYYYYRKKYYQKQYSQYDRRSYVRDNGDQK